ncbi:hypothetical protein [Chryseobacterium sp. JK1]|uniref:hypothetical protein n=1 Tax=Chryseobacterium sp. JK1 TaxID=874294 RepID=UPI003D69E0DD
MGIKIKKIKYVFAFLILSNIEVLGQNKLMEVKKYAFNKCLSYNYQKIDLSFYNTYKDASGVQFSINGNFLEDDELKNKIIDYTINETGQYYSMKNSLHFETGDKNIIFYNCFGFYESKELDSYIRKLIGVHPKKKTSKK